MIHGEEKGRGFCDNCRFKTIIYFITPLIIVFLGRTNRGLSLSDLCKGHAIIFF